MNKGPISQFITHHYRHFNAAALVDAAKGYEQHIIEGGKMMVTLAGAMSTAELGVSKQLVNSWISGYFPSEKPKYAFVVIMEKGSRTNPYGAVVAMKETLEWMRDNTEYTK